MHVSVCHVPMLCVECFLYLAMHAKCEYIGEKSVSMCLYTVQQPHLDEHSGTVWVSQCTV